MKNLIQSLLWLMLFLLLLHATYTDLRDRIIWDRIHIIGVVGAGVLHCFETEAPWLNYFLTGVGVLVALTIISVFTGGNAIGGGDIKAFAMIGFALGWSPFFSVFLISHLLAAVLILLMKVVRFRGFIRVQKEFPFAPFILLGLIISYMIRL